MEDKDLDEKLQLTKPKVIGLVITKRDGKIDLCPVNWQVVSSRHEKPMVVAIGLSNKSYTLENIIKTQQFVYCYPSKEQLKDVLYCGTVSGRIVDKLKKTSFKFSKSEFINVPKLKDAIMNIECKLHHLVKLGNYTLVIGKILKIDSSKKSYLEKIYTLGNKNYGIIEKVKILQEGRV